jgi:hypothetical protein
MIGCESCRNWSPKQEKCRKGIVAGVLCREFAPIPRKRDLDGCYFRVKRDGKWGNACFSDLTAEERDEIIRDRSAEWWKSLAYHVADRLRTVGDHFEIVGNISDEE